VSIVLKNVTKSYGHQVIVDRLTFDIPDGEFFVLLGASGSGKSTILRIIAGLTPLDQGEIWFGDQNVTNSPPQARGIGFVFQNYSIFPRMTVAENIEFGLKIRRIPAEDRVRRREDLLELVGMAGLGLRLPSQLSGGQQQRVALARALAYEPEVLLLDEPFGALDVKTRFQLRRSLKEIHDKLGITTILVTHDQEEAFELADRIGILARGRLLQVETAERLYTSPNSIVVASFVGNGTLLSGRAANGRAHFGSLSVPIPPELPYEEGERIQLFFRPEQIAISRDLPEQSQLLLGRGNVVETTFLGPLKRLRLSVPRLPGTRQISPPLAFGEIDWLLDCVVPSDRATENTEYWVSLSGWRLLRRPSPRYLVFDNNARSMGHLEAAHWLVQKLGATTTLFTVGKEHNSRAQLRKLLEERGHQAELKNPEILLRYGRNADQIIREQSENLYDLLIFGPRPRSKAGTFPGPFGKALIKVLEESETPLMFVPGGFRPIRRILICTAAGEPGKNDVRFGGRLARRLGASITLLHVAGESESALSIAEKHLERAGSTLGSFDLEPTIRVRKADSPAEGILAEAREGEHDLIILGGHGPHSSSGFSIPDDITLLVLRAADRPVIVVPEEEPAAEERRW